MSKNERQPGFSLLELMMAVSISMILSAVTYVAMRPVLQRAHLESAYSTTLMALRTTRNLAITQSHEYYAVFNPGGFPPGTILVQYQPPPVAGILPALQFVNTYTLPQDVTFDVRPGLPASTPDGFGGGGVPIDFGQGLGAGNLNYLVFMPDGSARDALGNYNSGVLYMTRLGDTLYNTRAVSVWGVTGRVRGWRLTQNTGVPIWVQE